MPQEPLVIQDAPGLEDGQRVLKLSGPLILTNIFEFQSKVRSNTARALIIDFTNVPYVDSAGIGALVGAYISHQKDGRGLYLAGVSDRIHHALNVTRVENFFDFYDSLAEAEQASRSSGPVQKN